ncbi:unnamed protein product [Bursaphelenchus xylophilus]|uniref:(pine wood nematode) hypothetical protein n=1 Tax=Bursaphelenchus xylophilus TaxID=6326 RepID=A0A1I7RJ79_BURXY|nr:unnamed protein product [Bursaphelenchus xylophilus]CAG9119444.1 unnamed protein product [Bursaphelenchus xylophilus]
MQELFQVPVAAPSIFPVRKAKFISAVLLFTPLLTFTLLTARQMISNYIYDSKTVLLFDKIEANFTIQQMIEKHKPLRPFVDGVSHMIYVERYKVGGCMLPKVMSTITTAFMCYMKDDEAFIKANRSFGTEFWTSREPSSSRVETNCYDCRSNMTCVVGALERRFSDYLNESFPLSYEDQHFIPQTWHCEMDKYLNEYKVLKYASKSSPNFEDFKVEYVKTLRNNQAPERVMNFVIMALNHERSANSTDGKKKRKEFLAELLRDRSLLLRVVKLYFYDFLVFQFPFPQGIVE